MQNNKYLVLDTETTGTDFLKHGLIQIAALALDDEMEIGAEFNIDVCPPEGTEITQQSLDITGFTLERIKAGYPYAQAADLFKHFVDKYFSEKPIVIAQFYPFDYAFTQALFSQTGFDTQLLDRNFIDTKTLANIINLKARLKKRPEPFTITSLSKDGGLQDLLGIAPDTYQAHDAMGDVLATREVLIRLIKLVDYRFDLR